jgi:anti-sigma B factor antagonist
VRVSERRFGKATVLDLTGPMVTPKVDGMIKAAVRRQVRLGPRLVVINFGSVPSIDAAGLGELIAAFTTLQRVGGTLRLASVPKRIRDVIEITHLTSILDIFNSVEDAVNEATDGDSISVRTDARSATADPIANWVIG